MDEINVRLSQAVQFNNLELAKSLIDQGAQVNTYVVYAINLGFNITPLQAATRLGHIQMINLLVDNGADVNQSNPDGNTPLHYAAAFSYDATVLLLKRGASLDLLNQWNENACFWAAQNNQLETLKLLLDEGADGIRCNIYLKTPFAMMVDHGNVEGMQILFKSGADINAKDQDGKSPLSLAIENRNINVIKWLHDRMVDLNTTNNVLCALKNKDFDIALLLCNWDAKLNLSQNLDLLNELNENFDEIANINNIHILEKMSGLMHIVAAGYDLITCSPESTEGQKLVYYVTNEFFNNIIDLNADQSELFESLKGKDITQSLLSIYQLAYLHKGYEHIKCQLKINHPEFCNVIIGFINNVRTLVDPLINHIMTKIHTDHTILDEVFEGKTIKDVDQSISLLKSIENINKEELRIDYPDLYRVLKIIDLRLQKSIASHQEYKFKALQYNLVKVGTIACAKGEDKLAIHIMKNLGLLKGDIFQEFATEYLCDKNLDLFFQDLKVSNFFFETVTSTEIQDELVEATGKVDLDG